MSFLPPLQRQKEEDILGRWNETGDDSAVRESKEFSQDTFF
jgi:hypothetical protein